MTMKIRFTQAERVAVNVMESRALKAAALVQLLNEEVCGKEFDGSSVWDDVYELKNKILAHIAKKGIRQ